jgi:outer membrane receptor protein involved in Fe transport
MHWLSGISITWSTGLPARSGNGTPKHGLVKSFIYGGGSELLEARMKITILGQLGAHQKGVVRSHVARAVCLVALFLQFSSPSAYATDVLDRRIHLDIAAHTKLEDALIEWGMAAGMTVMINTRTVDNLLTQRLEASISARKALNMLLKDTGLAYTVEGSRIRVVPIIEFIKSGRTEARPTAAANDDVDPAMTTGVAGEMTGADVGDQKRARIQGDMQEVVVTAQKREEHLQDVPISMSVLGGKELDQSSFTGVTDALSTVPGVAILVDEFGGGTQLSIRGVSNSTQLAGGASTVAYYIDGVPFGLVRNSFVPDPNVYDLKQIEVLRGPQGTLYGANALNGVVRVLTNDPDPYDFDLKVHGADSQTARGGNNYSGDIAVNVPLIDGKLAARAVIGYEDDSGWINTPVQTHINDAELQNERLKINAQLTDSLSIGLSAWHSRNVYGAGPYSLQDGTVNAVNRQPISTEFNAYGVKINNDFRLVSVSSMTSYIDYANTSVVDLTPYGVDQTFGTYLKSRIFAEELNLLSRLTGPWHWSLGAFYRDAKDGFSQSIVSYPPPPPLMILPLDGWDDTSKSTAVYGEVGERFFGDQLEASVGLRYYHDDEGTQAVVPPLGATVSLSQFSATSSATTPRAVLTWKPRSDRTIYASYSQGFRSGAVQEEQVTAYAPSFGPVKPDKLTNYEVGVKGTLFDRLVSYDAAAYYIKWTDIQQVVVVPVLGGIISVNPLVNGQSASGPGAEFAVTTHPIDGLDIELNASWNRLTMDSAVESGGVVLFNQDDRLNFSPEFTAGASLQYSFPVMEGFTGHLMTSGNYVSQSVYRQLAGTTVLIPESEPMIIARASVGIESSSHWRAAVYADNLTNNRRSPVPDPTFTLGSLETRPRTVGLQFDYHWR